QLNAIENLHNQNMTHRNIKPANILIGADGHLVLTGFASVDIPGFTGVCGGGEEGEDAVVMTPWYASPELLMGWENGPEVDLWALGVTVYEMLCGTV
ncbi:kinase-like protein, partial [Dentipellis sp. KUC8613]